MDCEPYESSAVTEETQKTKDKTPRDESEELQRKSVWTPGVMSTIRKEIYYFAGHEIKIWESLDSFGSIIWPAALALCRYLESNKETIDVRDKAVLEIGAGTGLVSIVASLLGAWVTATDLPEVLGNLRCNLSRNTRGHCRYTPQTAELLWGCTLDRTFPQTIYRYDYVLAADVVYHHDFLTELLDTMRHFCQPGTTLIWANKIRFPSDLVFTENFQKTFNANLLEDTGEIKIYSATMRKECEGEISNVMEDDVTTVEMMDVAGAEDKEPRREMKEESKTDEMQKLQTDMTFIKEMENRKGEAQEDAETENNEERDQEEPVRLKNMKEESEDKKAENKYEGDEENTEEKNINNPSEQDYPRSPSLFYYIPGKEIHYFLDQKITIQESIDSFGATVWPAAPALCRFLETAEGREQLNLYDKSVLELGAGTGLLSVVITLLGAKLTATDIPETLSNLKCNLSRNTRGRRRHEPLVTELFWGDRLEETFPTSTQHYDYVLATDVVYHHDYLSELLDTMRHFCQPGTTLVWANKVRYATDLTFIENFQKRFNSRLLTERDEVRIYVATGRQTEDQDEIKEERNTADIWEDVQKQQTQDHKELKSEEHDDCDVNLEVERVHVENDHHHNSQRVSEKKRDGRSREEEMNSDPDDTRACQKVWTPTIYYRPAKEIHHFLGHEIKIEESIDSYGAMIWPAALALCRFLDTPAGRQRIDLLNKSTLELGAGTGLVSIVATLLGAKLTATDLPEILGNLRCNLNRNTRCYRRHEPQVTALVWGQGLEETFPRSAHHYDYVLAADAVYHHDCLVELLETMRHFCQRGTTLIWANKIRYQSDLTFLEKFEKVFNSTLLTELDEVRIYSATSRESDKQHEDR